MIGTIIVSVLLIALTAAYCITWGAGYADGRQQWDRADWAGAPRPFWAAWQLGYRHAEEAKLRAKARLEKWQEEQDGRP